MSATNDLMNVKTYYEFINAQTGNVIGHLSLPGSRVKAHLKLIGSKKLELANGHKLELSAIYWQEKGKAI